MDTLLYTSNTYEIWCKHGIIQQLDSKSKQPTDFTPDSVLASQDVSFVNFGGSYDTDFKDENTGKFNFYRGGIWICMNSQSKQLIGSPYQFLSPFNHQGKALAQKTNSDDLIGIKRDGKEIKPNFHLESEAVFFGALPDTSQANIISLFQEKNLVDGQSNQEAWKHITSNYKFLFFDQYDEYGEVKTDEIAISVYKKATYFDYISGYPLEEKFVFNYFDTYGYLSAPNSLGMHWAIPKEKFHPEEHDNQQKLMNSVVVDSNGSLLTPVNYIPIASPAIHYENLRYEFTWDINSTNEHVFESLKNQFQSATNLDVYTFHQRYRDSVYFHYQLYPIYDPDQYEESIEYTTEFFQRKNLQHITCPPPSEVKYQFLINQLKDVEGSSPSKKSPNSVPENWSPLVVEPIHLTNGSWANRFGNKKAFVLPTLSMELTQQEKQYQLNVLIASCTSKKILTNLNRYFYYEKLVELGIAKSITYETVGEEVNQLRDSLTFDGLIYEYIPNMGLAIENQWAMEQAYLSIGYDYDNRFVAVDTNLNVFQYEASTKTLKPMEDYLFHVELPGSLILQSKKDLSYALFPKVYDPLYEQLHSTTPCGVHHIRKFYSNANCNDYYLINVWGEDSMTTNETGDLVPAMMAYCDTLVYGPFSKIPPSLVLDQWERMDGVVMRWPNETIQKRSFSSYVLRNTIVLNEILLDSLQLEEVGVNLKLSFPSGRTQSLTPDEYLRAKGQLPGQNGYGGFWKKGVFYSYNYLLPFPEKHKVYIHLFDYCWLIGSTKKLKLVTLENNKITNSYSGTFKNFDDYLQQLSRETDGVPNPIREYFTQEYMRLNP
jgi:hypothetical protein